MSTASPMDNQTRMHNYLKQNDSERLTAKQLRRLRKQGGSPAKPVLPAASLMTAAYGVKPLAALDVEEAARIAREPGVHDYLIQPDSKLDTVRGRVRRAALKAKADYSCQAVALDSGAKLFRVVITR